jgi:phospholipid/cholesterol/gamma-HCH transport system permease protein
MQSDETGFDLQAEGDALVLHAAGGWVVAEAAALDRRLRQLDGVAAGTRLRIDLARVDRLDTVGAWLVLRTQRDLGARGVATSIENVAADFVPLLEQVARSEPPVPEHRRTGLLDLVLASLAGLGKNAVDVLLEGRGLLGFFGLVTVTLWHTLRHPRRLRSISLVTQMERTGVTALPILGLLSFLIGVVLAYQGAEQLRRFGAEIFTINLLGVGILRELGVLLTAIIVAGRSGSAFTAEIGAMEVNEEVDAMRTLGLDPVEVLVLPRLFGLVLALPLLVVYADFMSLFGGLVMAWLELGIAPPLFLRQLHNAIGEWTFWVGVLKAPFFAATIALVGCHAGLMVSRSAESVGRLTTLSVVRSIFLVIIIDAAFSVLYARLGI